MCVCVLYTKVDRCLLDETAAVTATDSVFAVGGTCVCGVAGYVHRFANMITFLVTYSSDI